MKSKVQSPKSKVQSPKSKVQSPRSKVGLRKSFIGRRGARGVESMLSGKQSEIQPTGTIFKRVLQRVCKRIAGMVTGDPPSSDYGAASLAAAGQEWGCYAG
jgi:hypothetical protein